MTNILEVPLRGCDFCNGVPSDRVEALPAHLGGEYTDPESGEKVELQFRFRGDWTICSVCRELVEAGDLDGEEPHAGHQDRGVDAAPGAAGHERPVDLAEQREPEQQTAIGGQRAARARCRNSSRRRWGGLPSATAGAKRRRKLRATSEPPCSRTLASALVELSSTCCW